MAPRSNKWASLCKYINRRRNGAVIARQALLEHITPEYFQSDNTVDTYRNYLTKAGFLTIIRPGRYEKIKTIPYRISRRDVQRLGYDVSHYNSGW
jgi:hypothetical protein